MHQGTGFRICGCVVRRWTNQKGNFGTITLDVYVDGKGSKIDLVTFDCVNELAALAQGALAEVTGRVGMQKLKDRQGDEVKIDGFNKWVPQLVIRTIKTESSSRAPSSGATSSRERSQQLQEQTPPNPAGDQADPSNW